MQCFVRQDKPAVGSIMVWAEFLNVAALEI